MFICKKILDELNQKYLKGEKLTRKERNFFYQFNLQLRNSGVKYALNNEELKEYSLCYNSLQYFAENYCNAMTEDGLKAIKLRDFQLKALNNYNDYRFNIWLKSRQIGSTSCSSIFILYRALFYGESSLILSNKSLTSIEILDKIKNIYEQLPFFLKKGISNYNRKSIKFEDGTIITTEHDLKFKKVITNFFVDEFAFFTEKYKEKTYDKLLPDLLSRENSRIIINSTPNGFNYFYDVVKESESERSIFKLMKTFWWEVEGRDEEWKNEMIKILGSLSLFEREFELKFF